MKENDKDTQSEPDDGKTLNIHAIFDKLTDVGKARLELERLKGIRTASEFSSSVLATFVFLALCCFIFLLLNIGVALYIGSAMGDAYFGFIILAGFYSFIAIVYQLLFSKMMKKSIRNFIIKQLM